MGRNKIGLAYAAIFMLALTGLAAASEDGAAGRKQSAPALSLDEAITLAMEHNPQLGAAREDVIMAGENLNQAASKIQPRLDVVTTRTAPVDLPKYSLMSSDITWRTNFSLSQPIYTGGAISNGISAAGDYLEGAKAAYQRTRQQVAFAVRQAYYRVLTAEEQVQVSQEVVDSAKEHLRIAKLRYGAGVAPEFDVLAAQAYVARVQQGLISAQTELSIAREALNSVLGVSLPEGTVLKTPPPCRIPKVDSDSLKAEALAHRPDVIAARATVTANAARVAAERAAHQPTVSASIDYTLIPTVTIPGTDVVVVKNSGNFVIAANWHLYDGGEVTARIRAAEAQLRRSQQELAALELQVSLEVKSAYLQVQAAVAQKEAAGKEVEQAKEAHRIATLRYQEGVGTSVEVLDAEANLSGAKTRLNTAIYNLNLAVSALDLAVGRTWTPPMKQAAEEGK